MPRTAPRVCLEPGCPELVERPANRCERHRGTIQRACDGCGRIIHIGTSPYCSNCRPTSAKPQRWKPYNDPRWRKLSAAYRKAHPICERCRLQPSAQTDHRDGQGPAGPRGLDWSNLKALCKSCHSRKTARQDGGFGNAKRRAA